MSSCSLTAVLGLQQLLLVSATQLQGPRQSSTSCVDLVHPCCQQEVSGLLVLLVCCLLVCCCFCSQLQLLAWLQMQMGVIPAPALLLHPQPRHQPCWLASHMCSP